MSRSLVARRVSTRIHPAPASLLALVLALLAPPALAAASDLGRVEFPNSGSEAAQEPFERGLAALHSFWYEEAAELFREAQEADPDFALAYWGEALTHDHPLWRQQDTEAARGILERLGETPEARAAEAPTEREKAYLEAAEILFGLRPVPGAGEGEADEAARDAAYSEAMKRLAARFPEDPDASALYALSLQGLNRPGVVGIQDRMRSAAILEPLLDRLPEHPGVLHYMIHAYDDPVHAPLGLRAAVVYATVAPAAPHALHMPSHIFLQLGMWDRVVASNRDAWKASEDWVERRGISPVHLDFHSLSWLHYAFLQQGRRREAAATLVPAREVSQVVEESRPGDTLAWMEARQMVETRRWEPLELPEGEPGEDGGYSEWTDAAITFAAGLSAVHRGDLDAARRAERRLSRLAAADEAGEEAAGAVRVMARELAGMARWAEGAGGEALEILREAARMEEGLEPPSGPPVPLKPAHELLGEALLEAGRPEAAREQFELALLRTPNRALSLLGAARAARAAGDAEAARERYAELVRLWRGADEGLAEVAEARSAVHGAAGGAR